MTLNRLQREFEERRQNLVDTLQRGKDSLDLAKQHQIYGAIREIENFLKAIDYQREQQQNRDDFELVREEPRTGRAKQAFMAFGETLQTKVFAPAGKIFKKGKKPEAKKEESAADALQPPRNPNGQQ